MVDSTVVPPKVFPINLFDQPELFLQAEMLAILLQTDESLNYRINAFKAKNNEQIRNLASYCTQYLDKLHTINGTLFMEDRRVVDVTK